jgi:hypothetical protein
MKTYKALVKVRSTSGAGTTTVGAQVVASNPIQAKQLLEAQYGRGNVLGVPVLR